MAPRARPESNGPEQSSLSEFEQHLVWADLLAAHPSTASSAKHLLLELEKEHSGDPRTEELLGHIEWSAKHSEEARMHWTRAVERGSEDFETLYQLALALHAGGKPSSQVIPLLEKAVSTNPESDEAIYNLGVLKYGEGQYEAASQTLLRLRQITPDRAYTYYSVLAYCDIKARIFDRAKKFLLKAAESARTDEQRSEIANMMRFSGVRAD